MQYDDETLRRLQLAELDVLIAIDGVCRQHGIAYFLDSGTALGARRHGGFIPWDDDIDIGMPRDDYERFLEVAPAALGDAYTVADPQTDHRMAGLFAKVWKKGTKFFTEETIEAGIDQGIFVDVFPYDRVASGAQDRKKQLSACLRWQSLSYLYHSSAITVPHKGVLGACELAGCKMAHALTRAATNPQVIRKKFTAAATSARTDSASSDFASMNYVRSGVFPESVLLPTVEISFEGHMFPAPAKIEAFLEILYGKTWNELPPVAQRRNHAPKELDFGDWEFCDAEFGSRGILEAGK